MDFLINVLPALVLSTHIIICGVIFLGWFIGSPTICKELRKEEGFTAFTAIESVLTIVKVTFVVCVMVATTDPNELNKVLFFMMTMDCMTILPVSVGMAAYYGIPALRKKILTKRGLL